MVCFDGQKSRDLLTNEMLTCMSCRRQAVNDEDLDRDAGDHAVLSAGRQQRLLQEEAVLSYGSVLGQLQQESRGERERV